MSFSTFKDFAKESEDLFSDDFDTKCSLKVKSAAPAGVSLTTTTDISHAANVYPSKINLKWAHPSGFSIDKLEIAGCDKTKIETSLSNIPAVPGLKLEFKGANMAAGSLGAIYKHQLATVTSELDIGGFSSLSASVHGGAKGVSVGGSALFSLGNKFDVTDFGAGISMTPKEGLFVGVRGTKKFAEFDTAVQYQIRPGLIVAALGDCTPKTSTHRVKLGVKYECCPTTTVKVKVGCSGDLNASVKRQLPNNTTLVGAAAVNLKNPESFSFGLSATIG